MKVDIEIPLIGNYLYAYPPYPIPAIEYVNSLIVWDTKLDIKDADMSVYDINCNKVCGNGKIIPNPAKDLLSVSFDSDYIGNVKLDVYKLNGDLALSINRDKSNYSFNTPIDISALESGSYIIYIYINDSQMIWSNKFIIEK